jgi:hypothetical protein
MKKIYEKFADTKDLRIKRIVETVEKSHAHKEHEFYASLFAAIQKEFPLFAPRDIRNIQIAVSARANDFDLDPEWFKNLDLFFRKDYETKLSMLKELRRGTLGTLSFADIRREEAIRYLDSLANIASREWDRKVEETTERFLIHKEAERRAHEKINRT